MLTQMAPDEAGSPKTEEGKTVGVNTPAELTVIMHDGTGSVGLPSLRSGGVRNQNNEVFAYYSDMVAAGWFDSVELRFGPVGHTHNGMDAVHKIHNVDLGQRGPPGDSN